MLTKVFNNVCPANKESSDDGKQFKQPETSNSENQPNQKELFQNPTSIPSKRCLSAYQLGMYNDLWS